ncbi:MAG: hypothetical protein ACI9UR_002310 [Bacteroidia bacterium]|jgi:uncharacterized protein (DUF885 family)
MRKGLTIFLVVVIVGLLIIGTLLAKFIWFKPFSINHFFERAYIEFLWEDPEALSQTGALEPFWFSDYKSELTDVSPSATRRLGEVGKANLELLKEYDRSGLRPEEQVSYDVLEWFLKTGVEGEDFLFHDYPVTHISGPHVDLPRFMRSHPLDAKKDIENYIARLGAVDEKFGSLIDGLEERRQLGIVAPTFILKKAMLYCNSMVADSGVYTSFYSRFEKHVSAISLLNPKAKQAYLDACAQQINESVLPAYKRLEGYLIQLERSSLEIAGVWQLPKGDEYYAYCLKQNIGVNNSPDELYEIAKLEMSRIKDELQLLSELTGGEAFSNSTQTFGKDELGRTECLAFFVEHSNEINSHLDNYFSLQPSVKLTVLEVPERSSANRPLAFYIPPREHSATEGKLYVNTWRAENLTQHLAKSYAYHEGIPGHHLQKGIQADLKELPTFRRFLPFEAYTEGWAMYAEQLGHEMTGTEDLFDRIGLLQSDLFRTARMMTDIGLHHKKWLREQAVDFMTENTTLTTDEAQEEVDRYIVWPGQGCSYKIGQLKFLELRELAQIELREGFDLKEFHDVLLNQGAMPLEVLETRVRAYIVRKKGES